MSFRLFIYYCALCGGWAALVGWVLGRVASPAEGEIGKAGIRGMMLGLMVALGLCLVDAIWNLGMRRFVQVFTRVAVGILIGAVGGFLGGVVGQFFYDKFDQNPVFLVLGWTFTGLLIGSSIGAFEILSSLIQQKNMSGAVRKIIKSLIGGTVGGILGGILLILLRNTWKKVFVGVSDEWLWTPSATGFVALGMCIGLLVGLAQVILKEAWIKVEAGFRPGREMLIAKDNTTIGRAESCDIGLFGDSGIEKLHACILQIDHRYYIEDTGTPGGTFVNDELIQDRVLLRSGDLIRVGKSTLRFNERQKRIER